MGFPVNIVKFLRTPIFLEHLRWLLLVFFFTRTKPINPTMCEMCPNTDQKNSVFGRFSLSAIYSNIQFLYQNG